MTSDIPDMQAVLERLENLERQNRRLKRLALAALIPIGALLLMGQTRSGRLGDLTGQGSSSRTIEARAFVVKDAEGRVRARFGMHETGPNTGPQLELIDEKDDPRAELKTDTGGASLSLHNPGGPALDQMFVDCPADGKCRSGVVVTAPARGPRAEINAAKEGPTVLLYGKDKLVWRAP